MKHNEFISRFDPTNKKKGYEIFYELWQSLTENDFVQLSEVNTLQHTKKKKSYSIMPPVCVHSLHTPTPLSSIKNISCAVNAQFTCTTNREKKA